MKALLYCGSCNLNIEGANTACPLCGGQLAGQRSPAFYLPLGYSTGMAEQLQTIWYTITAVFILAVAAEMFWSRSFWLVACCLGAMGVVAAMLYALKSRENFGFSIVKLIFLISVVGVVADYGTGFRLWSVNYLIPFIGMAGSWCLTFMLSIRPRWFRDLFLYQLTLAALCAATLLLGFFNISTVAWPAVLAAASSLASVAVLIIFFRRQTLHEVKKRMHF